MIEPGLVFKRYHVSIFLQHITVDIANMKRKVKVILSLLKYVRAVALVSCS